MQPPTCDPPGLVYVNVHDGHQLCLAALCSPVVNMYEYLWHSNVKLGRQLSCISFVL